MSEQESNKEESASGVSRRALVTGIGAAALGGLVIGGGAGFALAPKGGSGGGGSASGAVKIGMFAPITGPYSGDGQEMVRGAEMAVAEINDNGGVLGQTVQLVTADVADMAPENFIKAADRLVSSEGVSAAFAGYTTATSNEFDIYAAAGVPLFHTNTLQANTDYVVDKKYTNVFQCCPTEVWYASGFINLMQEWIDSGKWTPSSKTAAVISSNDAYSISIAKVFQEGIKKLGWQITMYEEVAVPYADWGPQLSKIRSNPPGLIFITDYLASDLASFSKQFAESPTNSLVYQQYGPSVPEYIELAGDSANGIFWSTTIGTLPDGMGEKFREKYRKLYNSEPGLSQSGAQYDMVRLWARAAAQADGASNFESVCNFVKSGLFRGVVGTYAFDQKELTAMPYPDKINDPSLAMPHLTYQIQNKNQVLISPIPYTNGAFQLPSWVS